MKVHVLPLVLAIAAMLGGCGRDVDEAGGGAAASSSADAAASARPPLELSALDVARIERGRIERSLPLSGTLHPFEQTVVKARVAGELVALTVREGETVRRGQSVGRIDDREVKARLAERVAMLEAARAQMDQARRNREMNEALLAKNFISRNAADQVASTAEVNEANLRAAEAQLDLARKSLSDAVLLSPIAGVVAQRHAQPGEKLPVDGRVLTVVDLARMELEAEVPSSRIAQVKPGARLEFSVEGLPERRFKGRVERINPTADEGSRMVKVYVVLDNPDRVLRGGMFAKGRLSTGTDEGVPVIPASALREDGEGSMVLALQDGVVRRVPVRVGALDAVNGHYELIEGPPEGTQVLAADLPNVRVGDAVRLMPAAAAR
ncbi:efflux RND transporter periplasmic adaptor subunit [Methyloversatilis thermotolerans]|uniref:efflux RND transporter periplasmic adaptor subunit n=1 Tax=Methyloversatilis thermotolerans TaxID=1346290 RepID=UPI00039BAA5A|nr:efflux RND transporter periplasmic adaptor subunit [Methyloversatilis thermotolerans]